MRAEEQTSGAQPAIEDSELIRARQLALDIIANVEKVIVGKQELVRLAATALLCRGHLLIDGLPGMGKTMLARSLVRAVRLGWRLLRGAMLRAMLLRLFGARPQVKGEATVH